MFEGWIMRKLMRLKKRSNRFSHEAYTEIFSGPIILLLGREAVSPHSSKTLSSILRCWSSSNSLLVAEGTSLGYFERRMSGSMTPVPTFACHCPECWEFFPLPSKGWSRCASHQSGPYKSLRLRAQLFPPTKPEGWYQTLHRSKLLASKFPLRLEVGHQIISF